MQSRRQNHKSGLPNNHFSSVYTQDLTDISVVGTDHASIGAVSVTVPGFIKQLESLKPHKASGSDGIPPWFL